MALYQAGRHRGLAGARALLQVRIQAMHLLDINGEGRAVPEFCQANTYTERQFAYSVHTLVISIIQEVTAQCS